MKNFATISIKDLAIDCILGVSELERNNKQTVFVSLDLIIDASLAGKTDKIADTVNYRTVYEKVIRTVSKSKFHLLEALASAILAVCLEEKRVFKATVKVTKPEVFEKTKGVSVEMSQGE